MTLTGDAGAPFGARFAVQRQLGAGGMGVVYEALDRDRNQVVALKALRNVDASALLRFKNEFRSLADLEHPNLVRLGELFHESGTWFFTMELLEGLDFLSHVRPFTMPGRRATAVTAESLDAMAKTDRPATAVTDPQRPGYDEARLRASLRQLAVGLDALHTAGKVHRDVKPSNVIVTPGERLVLLDFGLITNTGAAATDMQVVGTATYMSPEQAASKAVGPESDWYSVGVMLYEALTGTPPFVGRAVEVLMNKQRYEPPPPRATVLAVPSDLDGLCVDLLRFDRAARPPVAQIFERIGLRATRAVQGSLVSQTQTPIFLGRDDEQAILRGALAETRKGTSVALFVHGASGLGKSALVRLFLEEVDATHRGGLALSGRCYERESVPYKAFDGILDALTRQMCKIDAIDAALLLPEDAALLARLFPVLRRIPAMARIAEPTRVPPSHELRDRAFHALRDFLRRLAARAPLVLFVDDFQWADIDSQLLLEELLRPPGAPPLLFVATARAAADGGPRADISALAARLRGARHMVLGGLSDDLARSYAAKLLAREGVTDANLQDAQAIATEAEGHPLFIEELVKHRAARQGAGPAGVRLDDALWERIARLEAAARAILKLVAVAGEPTAHGIIAAAAQMERGVCARWSSLLRAAHLVRSTGTRESDAIEPYHDRVREAVLAHLSEAERRELHGQLVDAMAVATPPVPPEVLVRHLQSAGYAERAATQALVAARAALQAVAFDRATELFKVVLDSGSLSDPERREINEQCGLALVSAGRGAEAAVSLQAAAEGATSAESLRLRSSAGEQLIIAGHVDEGLQVLSDVLVEIGERLPSTPRRALLSLLWQRFKLKLRGLDFRETDRSRITPHQLARMEIYRAVAQPLLTVDPVTAAAFQTRGLLLALRLGEPSALCQGLCHEIIFVSLEGGRSVTRAAKLLPRAQALADASGDPLLGSLVASAAALNAYYATDFKEAFSLADEAVRRLAGAPKDLARFMGPLNLVRVWCLRWRGEMQRLRKFSTEIIRDADRRGDRWAITSFTRSAHLAWLADDQPGEARAAIDRTEWLPEERQFHVQHWLELWSRGEIEIYDGKAAISLARFEASFGRLERSLLWRLELVCLEATWLRGRLLLASSDGKDGNDNQLAEVERMIKRIGRFKAPTAGVFAALLRAGVAGRRGDQAAVIGQLVTAAKLADERGLVFCNQMARWRLGQQLGTSAGAALVATADEWIAREQIKNPERMCRLFIPGVAGGI